MRYFGTIAFALAALAVAHAPAAASDRVHGCWSYVFQDGTGIRLLCFSGASSAAHTNVYINPNNFSENETCSQNGTFIVTSNGMNALFPEAGKACSDGGTMIKSVWDCKFKSTNEMNCSYHETRSSDGKEFRNSNLIMKR